MEPMPDTVQMTKNLTLGNMGLEKKTNTISLLK